MDKVGTFDNTSDIATKPVDQKTLERHLTTLRLTGDGEEHTSLMQVSGERRQVAGDLARLAAMAKQYGGCLVGLAAMLTKAEAREKTTTAEDSSSSDIFMKVAAVLLMMWTVLVVILTLKLSRKTPQLTMTTGSQTDDKWRPAVDDMTIQSIRHELARRRLPVDGAKPEVAARLSRALQQGS